MSDRFVRASELYDVASRTPIAHPAHQATDADVRQALENREVRADGGPSSSGTERETHIDDELGLFVPKGLREFDSQIVFRTPRATIQHFGSQPLDGYYGMIRADQFGDPDKMEDPKNPDLAPDRVTIKPQGEDPVTLTVDTDPDIRTDGSSNTSGIERWCPTCQWTQPEDVVSGAPLVCPGCNHEYPTDAPERSLQTGGGR